MSGTSVSVADANGDIEQIGVRGRNAGGAGPWATRQRTPSADWLDTVQQSGASSQSAQGQSQLAAPAWGTIRRRNAEPNELYLNWTAVPGASGYNVVCSDMDGWSWWQCGSVDSGSTTTFTVDKDKRDGRDQDLSTWRSYAVAVRAVTTDPAQASPWLLSATAHPARVPERATISVSRATGSVSVSWTPPNHAQGYEIECAAYDMTEAPQGPPSNEPSYTLCADVETATVTNGTIAFATNPSLDASNVTATGATLTIGGYSGAWYYKHTNAGATCDGPVAAGTSTKALTNLTAGTSYTFSAYSDSTCTTGNLLATAAQFTTPVTVSLRSAGSPQFVRHQLLPGGPDDRGRDEADGRQRQLVDRE